MSTQAFPVIPSASGGGGGGGDPAEVQWIDIEDLGVGYTASDPDALMTYSYNSGTKEHSFGLPTLLNTGTAYNDYSMSTTLGSIQFPRWSKALTDANAAVIDSDVRFVMMLRMYDYDQGSTTGWSVGLGFSRDETSTDRNTTTFNAINLGGNVVGQPNLGCVFISSTTSAGMTAMTEGIGQVSNGGLGTNKLLGSAAQVYSATNASGVARVGQFTVSAATPLYLQLFACTTGNVLATTGGTIKAKLQYAVLRMP